MNQHTIIYDEATLWSSSPSQLLNFWLYVSCVFLITIPFAIWHYFVTKNTKYHLTTERLKLKEGVLNLRLEELELYRVKDYMVYSPFFLRLFGLSNILLVTSDKRNPYVLLRAVKDAEAIKDLIRGNVERLRWVKGVMHFD